MPAILDCDGAILDQPSSCSRFTKALVEPLHTVAFGPRTRIVVTHEAVLPMPAIYGDPERNHQTIEIYYIFFLTVTLSGAGRLGISLPAL